MAAILRADDPGFEEIFVRLVAGRGARLEQAEEAAREIIVAVRTGGMEAVLDLTRQLDGLDMTADEIRVSQEEMDRAYRTCPPDLVDALEQAAERIRLYHERERPEDVRFVDTHGVRLGWRWTPVDSAGIYTPGGLAAYPSSVLMNAIPAKVAGVERVVMATPPGKLFDNPAILTAARIAGVDEIWKIGGAQAIAALAYGAGPLMAADVVVGPGNSFVAAAKMLISGAVGVDSVAGPSEVFVICDGKVDPRWIAADLLAQAEHDPQAQAVLFTQDEGFANAVLGEVQRCLAKGYAGVSARASWEAHGAIILVNALEDAAPLVNSAAPEHVQIAAIDADEIALLIRHAGAVFLGAHTPEALGDYVAGPSHVLPTMRNARYASGLSTQTFMKRTTLIGAGPEGFASIGNVAARLADAEGLPAHARSLRLRLRKDV